jgi:8-oxo-dGTP diphosphatase
MSFSGGCWSCGPATRMRSICPAASPSRGRPTPRLREVHEEVGLRLDPAGLTPFAEFVAPAHNRPPGTEVRLICFQGGERAGDASTPKPANEIAELAWFGSADAHRTAPAIRLVIAKLVADGLID